MDDERLFGIVLIILSAAAALLTLYYMLTHQKMIPADETRTRAEMYVPGFPGSTPIYEATEEESEKNRLLEQGGKNGCGDGGTRSEA